MNTAPEKTALTDEADLRPLDVLIQGVHGAFHDLAARRFFAGRPIRVLPAATFPVLVQRLSDAGPDTMGVMAIENSLGGTLLQNYMLLQESNLHVTGEVYLRIGQNLMALPGTTIEELEEVRSHPMAIAQCREFFRAWPHIRLVETSDTALSAREVAEQRLERVGAIASVLAAELYGLEVLAADIETHKLNYTRFLILGHEPLAEPLPEYKVSASFTLAHEVGSLHQVLAVLAAYQFNLTKIQSAPIMGRPWEYRFFIDFVAQGSLSWQQGLDAIRPLTGELRVLGAYPCGSMDEVLSQNTTQTTQP
ncbi:MAG: prephenate dehydratase [Bacteroidetes bacterium]|nr:MAG: prephenate dehydratase [Bacteroidota bacterium]